jgi:hypothetical protein
MPLLNGGEIILMRLRCVEQLNEKLQKHWNMKSSRHYYDKQWDQSKLFLIANLYKVNTMYRGFSINKNIGAKNPNGSKIVRNFWEFPRKPSNST